MKYQSPQIMRAFLWILFECEMVKRKNRYVIECSPIHVVSVLGHFVQESNV